MRGFFLFLFAGLFACARVSFADDSPPPAPPPAAGPAARNVELYQQRPLDGVNMSAVESYPNQKNSSLGIGVGIYPFNPYYTGFLINGNYLYRFSHTVAWEILNVSYAFSYQTTLTTELAQNYNVNPKSIDYLTLLVNTDVIFDLATGKFVFLKDYLRYFSFSVLVGGGFSDSTLEQSFGPTFGLRTEVFASSSFSWKLDVRDTLTVSGPTNFVVFSLNMGLNF